MKKLLLSAAFVAATFAVSAQNFNVVNLVANGFFEKEGYVQSVPGGYTWEPWNQQNYLSVLPDWELATGGEWNGGIELRHNDEALGEGDGDARPYGDFNYLHFLGFNDNGWTSINANQVVTDLVPGRTYHLEYAIMVQWPTAEQTKNGWAPDPDYGFSVAAVDKNAEGKEVAGMELIKKNLGAEADALDINNSYMVNVGPYEFTAPADGKVFLNLYLQNSYGDKNKKEPDLWMNVDCVRIYSEEGDETPKTGVNDVEVAEQDAPAVYYNLQGVEVANPAEGALYICKKGNKVTKVVL